MILRFLYLVIISVLVLIAFVCWIFDKNGCSVILSFKKFHSYWKKHPDRWILRTGWAKYHYYVNDSKSCAEYFICFTFIGWMQYRLWKLLYKKFERDESLRKAQMEFEKFMEDEKENGI